VALDLLDADAVKRVVESVLALANEPRVAVCSAWPWVDGCEKDPERSFRENVTTVQNLVAALPRAVPIFFYSTDHVFDGAKGAPYVESDAVNPPSVYARHKRAVEELLLARGASLVVRTAWVFGTEVRKKNFVYRVLEAARAGETLKVPTGQAGCPTWARWLAESTLTLADRGMTGVVHLTGSEPFTKAAWARAIAEELDLPTLDVREVSASESGQIAPRPDEVVLASERHELRQPPARTIIHAEKLGFV
ncbi:MAG: dTDP-4-dehydrorhamnose reductase, partial [Myxococcaceae bacterium]|nr:dTDP-4-dehydrorhamnose reductase [Myxococcaceae bacterium]